MQQRLRTMTLVEAARELGLSEYRAKKLVRNGMIRMLGRDEDRQGRPMLLDSSDVAAVGRQLMIGERGRTQRSVLVVDPGGRLEDATRSLRVAGLHVQVGAGLLEAIALQPADVERAVIVLEPPTDPGVMNLLHSLRRSVYLVVVGPIPVIPTPGDFAFDGAYARADYDELREIVRHAWRFVERRHESAQGSD